MKTFEFELNDHRKIEVNKRNDESIYFRIKPSYLVADHLESDCYLELYEIQRMLQEASKLQNKNEDTNEPRK